MTPSSCPDRKLVVLPDKKKQERKRAEGKVGVPQVPLIPRIRAEEDR